MRRSSRWRSVPSQLAAHHGARISPTRASRRRFRSFPASAWSASPAASGRPCGCSANLQALAAYGLNIDDLRTTISNANSNAPKGSFDGATQSYTINANDQLQIAEDYKNIVVAYRNGAPVHLSDVATVSQGAENDKLSSWVNTTPAILLNVQRQPGANVIAVVDAIKAMLPQIQAGLPAVGRRDGSDRPHQHDPRLGRRRASSN